MESVAPDVRAPDSLARAAATWGGVGAASVKREDFLLPLAPALRTREPEGDS
jgi:hypothetical protein